MEAEDVAELRLALGLVRNERDELLRVIEVRQENDATLRQVLADYDRRRASWWGRFLLWLLRKTT